MPRGFGARTYQQWTQGGDLRACRVVVRETDLFILAQQDVTEQAEQSVRTYRAQIEAYIRRDPTFETSLMPIDVASDAAPIIHAMAKTARIANVGPFAAVAGAVAEFVGRDLLTFSSEIIVENGGDIFAASSRRRIFGIYAGHSPLTGKLALTIKPEQMPCGVCTSSGTVGHSLSFGKTDATIVIAKSAALADACATAIGNVVASADDIAKGLALAEQIPGIDGVVVIVGKAIGAWGNIQFVKTDSNA